MLGHLHAQVPLADAGRVIAVFFEQTGDRHAARLDQRLVVSVQNSALQPRSPVVTARQNTVPRRRANRRTAVSIGKDHAGRRQPIQVRRGNFAITIQTLHVAVAQIVRKDINDVGFGMILRHFGGRAVAKRKCDQVDDGELSDSVRHCVQGTTSRW